MTGPAGGAGQDAQPTLAEVLDAAAFAELGRIAVEEMDGAARALEAARTGAGAVDEAVAGAVAARGGDVFARRLAAAHGVLVELHTTRDGMRDVRCRTCRTPRGRPAPWPCETLVAVRSAMGLALPVREVERLRDWGRIRNGTSPRTAWGRHLVEVCRAGHPPPGAHPGAGGGEVPGDG